METYSPEFEFLIKENGEQAEIYSILHQMSYNKYKNSSDKVTIPLIVLTAVIGFITGIKLDYEYMNLILGSLSVFVSIVKSIATYMKLSEKSENHRICSLQFSQVSKEIKLELSLRRADRQPVKNLLEVVKVKLKNLLEVAEIIEDDIIEKFKEKYPQYKYHSRSLPHNFNGITEFKICRSDDHEEYIRDMEQEEINTAEREKQIKSRMEYEEEEVNRKKVKDTQLRTYEMAKEIEITKMKIDLEHKRALKGLEDEYSDVIDTQNMNKILFRNSIPTHIELIIPIDDTQSNESERSNDSQDEVKKVMDNPIADENNDILEKK